MEKTALMTLQDLCDHLQVGKKTVYAWVLKGSVPYTKVGSLLRFDPDQIKAWKKTRTFIPRSMGAA